MDIKSIEDEIYDYCDFYFKDINGIVEDEMELIEANNLFQPKDNFIILFDYLNKVVGYFKNLDNAIMDGTLRKIYMDVNYLYKIYEKKKESSEDVKKIFENRFLKKSDIFKMLDIEISKYDENSDITSEERIDYEKLTNVREELMAVYFESFEYIFTTERKYNLHTLLSIINTKIYFLDKFFWKEVNHSKVIMRNLKEVENVDKGINSENYLKHRLKIMMPYSKDYLYLEKCLKVYK